MDVCTFSRPFDDQSQLKIKLETEANLKTYVTPCHDWKNIAKVFCVENDKIIEYAENLKQKNVRTKDALHIACSVFTNSDYFITTDKQLFNLRLNDIRIINPLTFINE